MKVLLSGYYGFDNAGDEAVLFSILQALRENGIADITVLSANPEKTEALYHVRAVNRWGKASLLKEIKACDVLVSGGGSLLQDVTSKNGILYYLGIIFLAEILRKKVLIYSQGIGPITAKRNRTLTKMILNKVKAITVRDIDSAQELKTMGVKRDIFVSADPVIGITDDMIDGLEGLNILEKAGYHSGKETVMVAVRNWNNSEKLIAETASAFDMLAEDNLQIVMVPFHYPEDVEIGKMISEKMKHVPVTLTGNYTPMETMTILKNADAIVGMRLHSLIMGYSLQKPLVAISYDPKVTSFMQMIQQESCFDVTSLEGTALYNGVNDAIQNRDQYLTQWKQIHPILEKQAKEPVQLLLRM